MIKDKKYYFFRLDKVPDDQYPEYRIAESIDDLYLRFGSDYLSQYHSTTKVNEFTIDHLKAVHLFLLQDTFS